MNGKVIITRGDYMTVYADMVFLVNFIMDSFILWIVSVAGHKKVALWRTAAGGLLMAGLCCLVLFAPALRFVPTIAASVVILAAGVAVTLMPKNIKAFARTLLTAYVVSFTVGGLGMVLYYLTDLPYAFYYLTTNPVDFMSGLSWKLPVLCVAVSYILLKLGLRVVERITLKRQTLCCVRVYMGETVLTFEALVDTGHSLREPITQSPVIVAEFDHVKPFLPESLRLMFYEKQENDLSMLAQQFNENTVFNNRVRMIPFSSLGRDNGLLIGFRPDRVEVGLPTEQETARDDVVIGIYNNRLTRDGRYHGLLSPELVSA